jgi:hypothetical protein
MSDENKVVTFPGKESPRELKPYDPVKLSTYAVILQMSRAPGDVLVTELKAPSIRAALAQVMAQLTTTPETPIGMVIERRQ